MSCTWDTNQVGRLNGGRRLTVEGELLHRPLTHGATEGCSLTHGATEGCSAVETEGLQVDMELSRPRPSRVCNEKESFRGQMASTDIYRKDDTFNRNQINEKHPTTKLSSSRPTQGVIDLKTDHKSPVLPETCQDCSMTHLRDVPFCRCLQYTPVAPPQSHSDAEKNGAELCLVDMDAANHGSCEKRPNGQATLGMSKRNNFHSNNLMEQVPIFIFELPACVEVSETAPVTFNCKFTAHPKADVTWLHKGNAITSDGQYILDESNDGNCLLIIAQASILHSGLYICTAENSAGKAQTICSLTVTKQGTSSSMDAEENIETEEHYYDTPVFESIPEDVYVLQGERASLTCKVLNNPLPLITWLRDHDVITNSGRFQTYTKIDGTCCLDIDDVDYGDIGEYECLAVNAEGVKKIMVYLDIAESPRINRSLESMDVLEGQMVRLNCQLDGIPEPAVAWYKDGRLITTSDRFKLTVTKDDVYLLRIYNFERDDVGEYSIQASNMAGEISCSAVVQIKEASDITIKSTKLEDKYEIFEELGRGAFGITKRCVSYVGKKSFAAKFIKPRNGKKGDIYREIEIMSCLDHQRLIKLYDAYETKEDVVMVMELVTGGELFERIIDQESFTEDKAAFFIRQVLEGLQYMHRKGVVHLDLKPENILLESEDRDDVKLIDFGLARKLLPGQDIICKQGTPEFVAPEVLKQQPVTTGTDVWSVGVIAYILLSGLSPFLGDNDKETLLKVKSGEWDFDDEVWDAISDDAKQFISKLLKEEPSSRLGTEESLQHTWLKVGETKYAENERATLSTTRLKSFNSRRKWQRALTAVKSAVRICRLSTLTSRKSNLHSGRLIDTQSASSPGDPRSKPTSQAGEVVAEIRTERIISETGSGNSKRVNEGRDRLSDDACLEENHSDWTHKENCLQNGKLPPINKDNMFADMNACDCCDAQTNKDNVVKEDTSCASHMHSMEINKCGCYRDSDTRSLEYNAMTEHAPLSINSDPNAVVINASDDLGRQLSMKLESSHTISAVTIESSAVGSTVLSDTHVSGSDTVTTLVGFFSEHAQNSITEALPNAAADPRYQSMTGKKPESNLSYTHSNGNTGSKGNGESSAIAGQGSVKSNGESSAIASQGSVNMRRRRLVKSLTIDQPSVDQKISCTSRRRIYSENDEPEENSESFDSVFADSFEDITPQGTSTSSSDSTISRHHPSMHRPSTLFSISENLIGGAVENGKSTNGEVFSPPSPSKKLTKRRSTYQTWSQESQDSIDIPITKNSQRCSPELNTDIMAADAGRQSQSKKRRSGFAFQPGQDSIPANAFLNTSEEESPKMLSVASVMMKLHMRQTARSPEISEESGEAKSTAQSSENIKNKKFTLTGSRELSPEDVETKLDFLTTSDDENLNYPLVYKMWLLQDNQYAHIAVGGLFGIFLALLIKLLCSIIIDAVR